MGYLWEAMKFSSKKNLGLDGRDFMLDFHTVRDCCGLRFEPRLMSRGLGCLFCDEMMYGCMEPNRFLFLERP